MTPQLIQYGHNSIDPELDQLTYSAYLLTLDPDLALAVVMAAIDTSMEDLASLRDLLRRTIEISAAQLRLETSAVSDRKSLALEALLYSDSSHATSSLVLSLKEKTKGNPILLLDSGARIAFVLHHVLGFSINGAAAMARISEGVSHTTAKSVPAASLARGRSLCHRRHARTDRGGVGEIPTC